MDAETILKHTPAWLLALAVLLFAGAFVVSALSGNAFYFLGYNFGSAHEQPAPVPPGPTFEHSGAVTILLKRERPEEPNESRPDQWHSEFTISEQGLLILTGESSGFTPEDPVESPRMFLETRVNDEMCAWNGGTKVPPTSQHRIIGSATCVKVLEPGTYHIKVKRQMSPDLVAADRFQARYVVLKVVDDNVSAGADTQ